VGIDKTEITEGIQILDSHTKQDKSNQITILSSFDKLVVCMGNE